MSTLLWLQANCCGGESVSLLNAEQPDIVTALTTLGYDLVWLPFFSYPPGLRMEDLAERIFAGKAKLGVLVVEGAIYTARLDGIRSDGFFGMEFNQLVAELAGSADYTLAAGTCASYGGLIASSPDIFGAVGLQFKKREKGGLLGGDYRSKEGLPVVNIPGCPAHSDWITETLSTIAHRNLKRADLDQYGRPRVFFSKLAHHACPRNEYYEFKASADDYSQQGCLFENLGCKGTLCESDCNERLWLSRTGSCPRGGFPCLSCTSPVFPDGFKPFFKTEKIGNIPTTLPRDVPKAWYVGMSGLAKLACPDRLKKNAVSHILVSEEENEE